MFCTWLFLVFSCIFLKTVANFRLFLNVAIVLSSTVVKTEIVLHIFNELWFATRNYFFSKREIASEPTKVKMKSDEY